MRRFTRTLSHTDVGALDYVVLFKFKKCGRRIEPDDALLKGQACDRDGSMRTAILGFIAAAYFTQIGSKKSLEESSEHEFTLVESSKAPY